MMQPQSTLFRGPNEHVGPLKKDQCALTPKTCPLRKALQWGEVAPKARVRGQGPLESHSPPRPNPLPAGERERAEISITSASKLEVLKGSYPHERHRLASSFLVAEQTQLQMAGGRRRPA